MRHASSSSSSSSGDEAAEAQGEEGDAVEMLAVARQPPPQQQQQQQQQQQRGEEEGAADAQGGEQEPRTAEAFARWLSRFRRRVQWYDKLGPLMALCVLALTLAAFMATAAVLRAQKEYCDEEFAEDLTSGKGKEEGDCGPATAVDACAGDAQCRVDREACDCRAKNGVFATTYVFSCLGLAVPILVEVFVVFTVCRNASRASRGRELGWSEEADPYQVQVDSWLVVVMTALGQGAYWQRFYNESYWNPHAIVMQDDTAATQERLWLSTCYAFVAIPLFAGACFRSQHTTLLTLATALLATTAVYMYLNWARRERERTIRATKRRCLHDDNDETL